MKELVSLLQLAQSDIEETQDKEWKEFLDTIQIQRIPEVCLDRIDIDADMGTGNPTGPTPICGPLKKVTKGADT